MKQYIANKLGEYCSPQVSYLEDVSGDYESPQPFLIKNNTDSSIELSIKPTKNKDYITTLIDPGWNPELCTGIQGAPSGIQIGR